MDVEFYVEKDLIKCEELWKLFSTNESIEDIWEFRLCFHLTAGEEPYFLVGKVAGEIIGVLPLEYTKRQGGMYVFFGGGDYLRNNTFFIKENYKKDALSLFLAQLPKETYLWGIRKKEKVYCNLLVEDQIRYSLNLIENDFSIDKYFSTFSSKWRQSVKREIRRIDDLNPEIVVNNFAHLENLAAFNKKRFGEDSVFVDQGVESGFLAAFQLVIDNELFKDKIKMISVSIGGQIKAVMFIIFYNGICNPLLGGNDTDIPNLFKYLVYQVIKDAMELKMKEINFMTDDCGWKEHWALAKEQLYCFENK